MVFKWAELAGCVMFNLHALYDYEISDLRLLHAMSTVRESDGLLRANTA